MRELCRDDSVAGEKPWDPQNQKEAVLDTLTGGITRKRRMRRVMMYYKRLDHERLDYFVDDLTPPSEMTPTELPDLTSDVAVKRLALVGLEVARSASAVQLEVQQTCVATATRASVRSFNAKVSHAGGTNIHGPTLHRAETATGKDPTEKTGALVVLAAANRSTVDLEGVGRIASEYANKKQTNRHGAVVTFMIQGLPMQTAETFVSSLRRYPDETLDSVMYTTFDNLDPSLPGRSLLQNSLPDQPEGGLFAPNRCEELTVVHTPAW